MKKDLTVTLSVMILLTVIVGVVSFTLSRQWVDYYRILSYNLQLNSIYSNLEFNLGVLQEKINSIQSPISLADKKIILNLHKKNILILDIIGQSQDDSPKNLDLENQKINALYHEKLAKIIFIMTQEQDISGDNALAIPMTNLEKYSHLFNLESNQLMRRIQQYKKYLYNTFEMDIKSTQKSVQNATLLITISSIALGVVLMSVTINRISKLHAKIERQILDIENINKELEETLSLNITIQEDERLRIARDLHDAIIQDLIAIIRTIPPQNEKNLKENLNHVVNQVREICQNLRPLILDDLGLFPAIEWLFNDLETMNINFVGLLEGEEKHLPHNIELTLFRVAQEIASNIKKHSLASVVKLTLQYHPNHILMNIEDNGIGFDRQKVISKNSLGLRGLIERVKSVKGVIDIRSSQNQGAHFSVSIPI